MIGKILCFCIISLGGMSSLLPGRQAAPDSLGIKIDKPVNVDGRLDEPPWKRAPEAGSLLVIQQDRRKPASVTTSVKILFDDTHLYIGFFCRDEEPALMIAHASVKDGDIRNDDSVYALIEAAKDDDNYYFFGTNLAGIPSDGKVAKDGQTLDLTWDGTWQNACQRTSEGWSAELAIDLSGLDYEPGKDKTMSLVFSRVVPRLDRSFWSEALDPAFRMDDLQGLGTVVLLQSGRRPSLDAYVLAQAGDKERPALTAGLEKEFSFSPVLSARLSLNPEYMTVEPDQEQVNLSRFEVFLPEKRAFFLNGTEWTSLPIPLFYTKRIGDIYGGAWVRGESEGTEYWGMTAQSKADDASGEDSANFSALRLKRTWGRKTTIGVLASNKLRDGLSQGAAGMDFRLSFGRDFSLTGQWALSYGDSGRPSLAFHLSPSFDTETFHFHVAYSQLGERFGDYANAVAFIRDDNRREFGMGLVKRISFEGTLAKQLSLDSFYDVYWGLDGTLRSWEADGGLVLELQSKFTLGIHHQREYKLYEKDFRNHRTRLDLDFNKTERWQAVGMSVSFGRNFDFVFDLFEIRKRLAVSRRMSLEYDLQRLKFKSGRGIGPRSRFIHVLRAAHTFSRVLSFNLFFQSNSAIGKTMVHAYFKVGSPVGRILVGFQQGTGRFGEKGTQRGTFLIELSPVFK